MNIAKYKDKWRCQVYKNGIRKSGTFATKTEASDWGKRTEIELSDAKAELGFTFGDACDKYIAEVSSKKDGGKWEVNRIEALRTFFGTATLLAEISAPQIANSDYSRQAMSKLIFVVSTQHIGSASFNDSNLRAVKAWTKCADPFPVAPWSGACTVRTSGASNP